MSKRPYRWKWTAQIQRETLVELQELADSLGFVVEAPGHYFGAPSPSSLLDSIATAHRHNPTAVRDALRALGVVWQPEPPAVDVPDAPPSS